MGRTGTPAWRSVSAVPPVDTVGRAVLELPAPRGGDLEERADVGGGRDGRVVAPPGDRALADRRHREVRRLQRRIGGDEGVEGVPPPRRGAERGGRPLRAL